MEERERRRGTFTVKGLVHDSHFYVNARPEVKCCEDAQQTLTRQPQSKGVLIGKSSFTTPSPPVTRTHPRWICCLMEAVTPRQLPVKLMDCLVHSSETNRQHNLFPALKHIGAVWVFWVNSAVH